MLNKLLQRQVQKYLGGTDGLPENFLALLKVVSESYDHYEKDRRMLERSIDLSSNEMIVLNEQLRRDIEARKESEKRYRIVHETPFLGIALGSMDGILHTPNDAFCRMLGYTQEELSNKHFSYFTYPEDIEKELPFIRQMMTGETDSYRLEKRYIRKSGEVFWVELNVSCSKDEAGQIQYVIAVVSDISQRKEAEVKLEKSEKKFRAVVEYGVDLISMMDLDTTLFYVSPSYEKQFGYTSDECIGKSAFEFIHPDDIPGLQEKMQDMLSTGSKQPYHTIQRVRTKEGKYFWCEGVSINMLDVDGVNAIVSNFRNVTRRKEAEEELERTLGRFRLAQEIAHIGHWDVDLKTYKSTWSEEAYRIYGLVPGSAEGSYELFLKHVHPDDLERVKKISGESMHTFESFMIHHRIIDDGGNVKHVLGGGRYELDKDGRPTRLFGIVLDLTELKEKEAQLQKTEANLRNLLENTETAYVLLDTEARILSCNHLARNLAKEEMNEELEEGMNYISIMNETRRDDVREKIRRVLQARQPISYDVRYQMPGRPAKWLHISMYPIVDDQQRVLGLSVAATDITNRKNAEQQIQESNERYELVTKATNDVIWDWDIIRNRIYRSANYRQVFGFEENENNLASWLGRIHPDDRKRISDSVGQVINNPEAFLWEEEYRYFKSNGEAGYVQDRGYITRDEHKKPVRMVGAMRDITSEKLYAIEREKITSRLIRQNKDLEQFAYIVSHNLRAPVANILGLSKIIPNDDMPADYRKQSLDGLVKSAKKLDSVIMDLNHILQVRHEISESKEQVCLSALINDIRMSVGESIHSSNVLIKTDFSSADSIYTLKSYLYSIFYNLISNSIKYRNKHERPVIEIFSRRVNGTLSLIIKDNGMGIDLTKHGQHLFGLYKRFHPNTEGKGMGLFMVKTQIETLGGRISVKSEVDKGTEFILEFEKQAITK